MATSFDFSRFLQPVSDESPSGPDLELAGDGDFFNYTLPAESRLPAQYLDVSGKIVFDRSALNLDSEVSEISSLLERSRDLRVSALLAQFAAAGLSLELFSQALSLMHGLLQEQWDTVHPQGEDGDFTMRKIAIEALDDRVRVAIPLTFIPIVRGKSAGVVTYRACEIAANPAIKRPVEDVLPMAAISEAFKSADGRPALSATAGMIAGALSALRGIRSIFLDKADYDMVPQLPNTLSVLEGIENAIRREAPELFGESAAPSSQGGEPSSEPSSVGAVASPSPAPVPIIAAPLDGPRSLGEAAAALEDIETYFSGNEPSSPALLLVHQARKLIGRPLIEAVEALAGSRMDSAQIKLGPPGGFTLSIERLRQLSSSAGGGQPVVPVRRADQKPVTNRSEAQAAMLGVEQFLSAHEPSSPIPLLLGKARQLMVKDFPALLSELIEPSTS